MNVQIKEVLSRKDLKAFIRFPNQLYRSNAYYVPSLFFDEYRTLHRDKNPAFAHCEARYWLAYHQGRIVGRIAGIINRLHLEKWHQRYLRFGWIDFIDEVAVSEALLGTVESWAREKGLTAVHGPLGFTDLDPEGMLVQGFDELSTLVTIYNYPYYPVHLEKLGYVKDTDWVEYEMSVPPEPNETIARIADIVQRRYNLRLFVARTKKELLTHGHELFQLLNHEYRHLYGFVPLTERQMQAYTDQYLGFIKPEYVPLVFDQNNQMIAFGITMPSFSRALQKAQGRLLPFGFIHLLRALNKNDRADLHLVAVKSEYRFKGVNAILIHQMNQVYNHLGVVKVEASPELETNRQVQEQWKYFEKRQHKRRRCYIKHLSE